MDEDPRKDPIGFLDSHLIRAGWSNAVKEDDRLYVSGENPLPVIEKLDKKFLLHFVWRNTQTNEYGSKNLKVIFDKKTDLTSILYFSNSGYDLSYGGNVKRILQLTGGGAYDEIETIEILPEHKKLNVNTATKVLGLSPKKYIEILADAKETHEKAKSYQQAISRYLLNKLSLEHVEKETQAVTTLKPGEFEFLVHRFNLETKKQKN